MPIKILFQFTCSVNMTSEVNEDISRQRRISVTKDELPFLTLICVAFLNAINSSTAYRVHKFTSILS